MRSAARLVGAVALAAVAVGASGCSKGVAIELDVEPGCVGGAVKYTITASLTPDGLGAPMTADLTPSEFLLRHGRVVIVPPDGTRTVAITVRAVDAANVATDWMDRIVDVSGKTGVIHEAMTLDGAPACGAIDAGSDGPLDGGLDAPSLDGGHDGGGDGAPVDASPDLTLKDAAPDLSPVDAAPDLTVDAITPPPSDGGGGTVEGGVGVDGSSLRAWTLFTPSLALSGVTFYGVWASASDVFAVGEDTSRGGHAPAVFHLARSNNVSTLESPANLSKALRSVTYSSAASAVVTVGDDGAVLTRANGTAGWSIAVTGAPLLSVTAFGSAASGGIVTVGPGAAWQQQYTAGSAGPWTSITVPQQAQAVVGTSTALWVASTNSITRVSSNMGAAVSGTPSAIDTTGSSSSVFVVGANGLVGRATASGSGVSFLPTKATVANLRGVVGWGSGSNEGFAVGDNETILYTADGSVWTSASPSPPQVLCGSNTPCALYAVSGPSSGDVWAVGQNGTILHYH